MININTDINDNEIIINYQAQFTPGDKSLQGWLRQSIETSYNKTDLLEQS